MTINADMDSLFDTSIESELPAEVITIGKKRIRYHWRYGRVTLTWKNILPNWKMATGIVRIHDDENNIPGDYHSSVTVIVQDRNFELEAFIGPKPYGPKKHEFKAFYEYLEIQCGLIPIGHVRARTGFEPRVVPA